MSSPARHSLLRGGTRLSYQVVGSGPGLVLIAGYGRSGSSWLPWLTNVAPLPFRTVLIDNRGTGESAVTPRLYGLPTLADDVAAVLADALGDAPAIVVGHSMGAMVAQHLALRHPSRVRGMVLSSSSARVSSLSASTVRSIPVTALATASSSVALWSLFDHLLVHPARGRAGAHALLAPLREVQRGEPYSRLNCLLQLAAMSQHKTHRSLASVRIPAEVLVGAGDRILPPSHSRHLAQCLPDARLTVLDDAGHEVPAERPDAVLDAITRLAARTAATASAEEAGAAQQRHEQRAVE